MEHPFLREEMALGTAALERLSHSHVAVFGIGGVGSFTVEALARGGVGQLTLVDNDTVGLTNLNRQLCALHSTLGQYKAQVMADFGSGTFPPAARSAPSPGCTPKQTKHPSSTSPTIMW